MTKLRVAMIGCGWVAGIQVQDGFLKLRDRFEVCACCASDIQTAEKFANEHGIPVAERSFADVVKRDDIDVVSICTPPSLHFEMVKHAVEAGKHVICEKPFTSSLALMDQVIEMQRISDVRVMPIFQYRFGRGIAKVRHLIRSGIAGRAFISSVETALLRNADYYAVQWRGKFATELGGVLLTQSIHLHDLLFDLIGPAREVMAFKTTRVNPIEVEDCAVASLQMKDGSLASLTATLGSIRPTTRIRLCFENMTIERQCFDDDTPRPGDEPWEVISRTPEIAAKAEKIMQEAPIGEDYFAGQFADFHSAIIENRPFIVELLDARRSLELITALFHSAETGESVTLPVGPEHQLYSGWVSENNG